MDEPGETRHDQANHRCVCDVNLTMSGSRNYRAEGCLLGAGDRNGETPCIKGCKLPVSQVLGNLRATRTMPSVLMNLIMVLTLQCTQISNPYALFLSIKYLEIKRKKPLLKSGWLKLRLKSPDINYLETWNRVKDTPHLVTSLLLDCSMDAEMLNI